MQCLGARVRLVGEALLFHRHGHRHFDFVFRHLSIVAGLVLADLVWRKMNLFLFLVGSPMSEDFWSKDLVTNCYSSHSSRHFRAAAQASKN